MTYHRFVTRLTTLVFFTEYLYHSFCRINKHYRIPKGQSKMDNPEKLATYGTQDKEKQNKYTTQCALDTTKRKQTQIT